MGKEKIKIVVADGENKAKAKFGLDMAKRPDETCISAICCGSVAEQVTKEMTSTLIKKKDKVLTDHIKSLGIEFDPAKMRYMRFKPIAVETSLGTERWFYNDGTPQGKLIAEFYPAVHNMSVDPVNKEGEVSMITGTISYRLYD